MNFLYRAALCWFWLRAHLEAIHHTLRGHDVSWYVSDDELRCLKCPDIEDDPDGRGMVLWGSEKYFQGDCE